jgi:hypothetical protein
VLLIQAESALAAWREAVWHLAAHSREEFNLIVEINDVTSDDAWLRNYNPKDHAPRAMSAVDVANTIFPQALYMRHPVRGDLYRRYLSLHRRAKRIRRSRAWGTYFERLISFNGRDDNNQLEKVILALRNWRRSRRAGLVFHLSSPLDTPRPLGAPCWQFGELIWHQDDRVDFVVVYRNHDYFNKALPNFVGLARLLEFICAEAEKTPGTLTCHAVHAYFDPSAAFMREFSA